MMKIEAENVENFVERHLMCHRTAYEAAGKRNEGELIGFSRGKLYISFNREKLIYTTR